MSDKKAILNTVIEGIAAKIERAIADNNGKVPYGTVTKEILMARGLFPDLEITCHCINNMLRRRRKKFQLSLPQQQQKTTPTPPPKTDFGRPKGTS